MSAEAWKWVAEIAALGIVVVLAYELWMSRREERAYDRRVHDRMVGISDPGVIVSSADGAVQTMYKVED